MHRSERSPHCIGALKTLGERGRFLLKAPANAMLMVAVSAVLFSCAGGSNAGGTGSDGSVLLSPKQGFSNTTCSPTPCAVGSDGVAVSVAHISHTKTPERRPVLEF